VRPALEQTLRDLKLDYLDLYLIHWPQSFARGPAREARVGGRRRGAPTQAKDPDGTGNCAFAKNADGSIKYDVETTSEATWAALEACVDAGLTKAIGLSNFTSRQVQRILDAGRIPPAVLQVEVHPYFSQKPLVEFCEARGIAVTAYSPLGSGATIDGATVASNATLARIGEARGKSAAQVAIAWLAQRGLVVIPTSVTRARVAQNRDVDFALSAAEMAEVDALNKDIRIGFGGPLSPEGLPRDVAHPLYPFKPGAPF